MEFPTLNSKRTFRSGVEHISRVDPKLRGLVRKIGPIEFKAEGDPFESLVESIISQQLNGQAARSIYSKMRDLLNGELITAEELFNIPISKLRKVGVSPQKISYLKDLSSRVIKREIDLENLSDFEDAHIIRILDEVRGIGPWTAQMFLLFTLGRIDVLPVDDLGIQMGIRRVYSLRKLPDAKRVEKIAKKWHPYCSVASLYLWRSKS